MQFLDLYSEILLTVINVLPDKALINFSCTCHEICDLARSQLKARKAQKYTALYSKIVLDASQSRGCQWKNPMQVMKAIHRDPIIAQYIQSIHYSPPPHYDYYPSDLLSFTNDDNDNDYDDERYEIEADIDELPFLGDEEKQKWKEAVSEHLSCRSYISFVILLSSCTKVTTLTLSDLSDLPRYLNPLIRHWCDDSHHKSIQKPELDATYNNSSHPPNQLLRALTTLGLCCPDNQNGLSLQNDFSLFAIPTLRTLYFDRLIQEHWEDWSHWVWASESNRWCSCEVVEMFWSILNPQNLIRLIGNLPRLKTLKYSHYYEFRSPPSIKSQDEFVDQCWRLGKDLLQNRCLQMTFGQDRGGQLIVQFDKLNEAEEVKEPLRREMEGISRRSADGAMISND